ncbi:zinc ABC transporter substrate-binding protein [Roseovarius nanhaiticus]|nr:zinc ABC transporter substrate-binding protein [Roseovarius nanhaiticus]
MQRFQQSHDSACMPAALRLRSRAPWLCAALLTGALGPAAAAADVPRVVTDIAPLHSLAARVMAGLGAPEQVVRGGASPHGYAMRPSEAAALASADAVFWIGPELTPWLEDTIGTVAPDADVTALLHAPGATVMAFREGPVFDNHGDEGESHAAHDDHDHGHEDHQGHAHEGHSEHGEDHTEEAHEDDHDHAHDHADEGDADEGDADEGQAGHDHAGHDHSGEDPHAWLSPENAKAWLDVMAEKLAELDPENAEAYAANAAEGRAEIDAAAEDAARILAPAKGARFVVFHDAYHYFEHHFGIHAVGSIAAGDASDPGPARLEAVRAMIRDLGVTCVLSEPALSPAVVRTVIEGSPASAGVIDPLGGDIPSGADFYPALLRDVATRLAECAG